MSEKWKFILRNVVLNIFMSDVGFGLNEIKFSYKIIFQTYIDSIYTNCPKDNLRNYKVVKPLCGGIKYKLFHG